MSKNISKYDRVAGGFYGLAIGDALGATTEFMQPADIARSFPDGLKDIVGGGWLNLKAGKTTDDTAMALIVADAVVGSYNAPNDKLNLGKFLQGCKNGFVAWYKGGPVDVGNQCRKVIGKFARPIYGPKHDQHFSWFSEAADPNACGNGSLMRAYPAAVVSSRLAVEQGRLTHNNSTCDTYIAKYVNVLRCIDKGVPKERLQGYPLPKANNGAAIWETYEGAMYWFANTDSFEDCLIGIVNAGGDADTIGAVAGSIAGYYYGVNNIPKRWMDGLDDQTKQRIDGIIGQFGRILGY